MSYTKAVVVIRGTQDGLDNLLLDLFEIPSEAGGVNEESHMVGEADESPSRTPEFTGETLNKPYRRLRQRFNRGMSCRAAIQYRERDAVILDIVSPRDLHLYYDLIELSEQYEALIDYWESDSLSVTYSGQILAGTELYRIDAFYSQEKKHEALGKSIRVRIAPQMIQELAEQSNFKQDLAKAFKDADIPIPF